MEGERIAKADVEVMTLVVVIWIVKTISEVSADYEHSYIDAQANSCTEGYIAQECPGFKFSSGSVRVVFKEPDITGINE